MTLETARCRVTVAAVRRHPSDESEQVTQALRGEPIQPDVGPAARARDPLEGVVHRAVGKGRVARIDQRRAADDPREVAHRVAMMDEGVVIEDGPPALVFGSPRHERTQAFLSKIL